MGETRIHFGSVPPAPPAYDRENEEQFRRLVGDLKHRIDTMVRSLVSDELDGDNIAYTNVQNVFTVRQEFSNHDPAIHVGDGDNNPGAVNTDYDEILRFGRRTNGPYIVARQLGGDPDSQGLRIYTHPTGTFADPPELAMELGVSIESPPIVRVSGDFTALGNKLDVNPSSGQAEIEADSSNSVAFLSLNAPAGNVRDVRFRTAGVGRWNIRCNQDAESGGNAGSTFIINARNDAGASLGNALEITRSSLAITIAGATTINNSLTTTGIIYPEGGIQVLTADEIYVRGSTFAPGAGNEFDAKLSFGAGGRTYFVAIQPGSDNDSNALRLYTHPSNTGADPSVLTCQWRGDPATDTTALYIQHRAGGTLQFEQVEVGATDSGGTGYRVLRIPN